MLSEYDPEIADLFDKILTAEIVVNAGNPGTCAADEAVDEQGVPTADEPTAVAFREVVDLIDSLPLDKQQVIVRAFTSFFHLANLSEENYRVAQLREREAGRIRNLGWSFHGDQKVFDHLLAMHDSGEARWDFVQIQMNYVDWKHASDRNVNAEYLYGELEKRGIPAVIMEPLLGGRLSRLNDHLVERLKERRPTESTASWAFRYAGSWPGVLTVLSGMTYMEHLQDNIRTYSPLEPCTGEELALLEDTAQLMLKYPTVPCTECQYCMPCPYGLDIPAIFAHYNRCVNEGNVPKDRQDPGWAATPSGTASAATSACRTARSRSRFRSSCGASTVSSSSSSRVRSDSGLRGPSRREGLFLPNVNFRPAGSEYLCTPKNECDERQY